MIELLKIEDANTRADNHRHWPHPLYLFQYCPLGRSC